MLKLYVIDYGWAGVSVVVADSLENAKVFFRETLNYDERDIIEETDIKPGIVSENMGDR